MSDTAISFEEALRESEELLQSLEEEGLLPELMSRLNAVLSGQASCRGFFVSYLTGDSILADEIPEYMLEAISKSDDAADLLCKNLVMSTAMRLTHERKGDAENAEGSQRVCRRAAALIRRIKLAAMRDKLIEMRSSIKLRTGVYAEFLKRWSYDDEQLQAVMDEIEKLIR